MRFFEEKVHSLSVAPEPLAIWNKELEGLESELFKELKTSPVVAPEHIPGFFLFSFVFKFPFLLTCFLVLGLALRVEKQKLSEGIEEMKTLVRNNHNRAEEVITRAEEELALAKLIRRGADRDLVQVQKTVEVLTGKLVTATEN